jgi:hypothetical protein
LLWSSNWTQFNNWNPVTTEPNEQKTMWQDTRIKRDPIYLPASDSSHGKW